MAKPVRNATVVELLDESGTLLDICELDDFFQSNEMDDEQREEIVDALNASDSTTLGGGACPLVTVRICEDIPHGR